MNAKLICALLAGAVMLVSVCTAEDNRLKRHYSHHGSYRRPPYNRYPYPGRNPGTNNPGTNNPAVGLPIGQPTTVNQPAQGPVTINLTAQQAQLLRSILALLGNAGAAPAGK
ncbi:uncharacterized protein LOC101847896 [Aplysia californica]|uniref:Uncharacterized protein LOC101847896 n=1 Tax=Aplysia californica TaxID=6500 RepID=A0ABM0K056_APLCA|nr:uncharacterized protein LOC101847896 [Aplysia californica]